MTAVKCPGCGKPMTRIYHRAAELDQCSTCRAIWFDGGELQAYLEHVLPRVSSRNPLDDALPVTASSEQSRCPRCKEPTLAKCYNEGLYIQRCIECCGVFLLASQIGPLKERKRGDGSDDNWLLLVKVLAFPFAASNDTSIL